MDTPIVNWNSETEVCLFYALRGHKPVGLNKHFHMMGIHKKFCQSIGQNVSSDEIWKHLNTMYNLKALDESESLPFKNNRSEFKLPSEIVKSRSTSSSSEPKTPEAESTKPAIKTNRKRSRNQLNPVPATTTTKRRKQ